MYIYLKVINQINRESVLYLVKADMGKQIVLEVGWGLFTRNQGMVIKGICFPWGHIALAHIPHLGRDE